MSESFATLRTALAGRYALERELGRGGMATVYLAEDLKHKRRVAIKVLLPELASLIGPDRFLHEIRTTANLSHPHILPLHDSGDAGGTLYYVMPLVEGESLRQRLNREKTLAVDDAVRLASEVADALGYAHAHGVIHRDIKPENILLQAGHALVADFGIARAFSGAANARTTTAGVVLGTPSYMSPEQASGDPGIDARTDLYALAAVLYEMLAGEPPYTGATFEAILLQRFTQTPPRVTVKRPNVPRAVEAAITTALARAPEDRFAGMMEFAQALRAKAVDTADRLRSIAVLPFANMSQDRDNEYFSDGISEEIINALTQVPGLRVAARTSAFSFKGKSTDLRVVGDQLQVDTVLEGSVRRMGNRIRITAQLIKVADGYHLWSERYDRELTDVFAIQDEIANAIVARLKLSLGPAAGQLVKAPTANLDAYELYLKGRALALQRGYVLLQAVDCFERAVALDPGFAAALAELTTALILLSMWGVRPMAEVRERAVAAGRRALELEPSLVSVHVAAALVAFCIERDRLKGAAAFARAVELDPSNAEARALRALYDWCYVRGQFDRAVAELALAVGDDPLNASLRSHQALALGWSGRLEDAEQAGRRGVEIAPGALYPAWGLLHAQALGRPDDALEAAPQVLSRFGRHPWLMMGRALAALGSGKREVAEAIHLELVARARTDYVQPFVLGVTALIAGNENEFFEYLERAVAEGDPMLMLTITHWPPFASVKKDQRFLRILDLMGWSSPIR